MVALQARRLARLTVLRQVYPRSHSIIKIVLCYYSFSSQRKPYCDTVKKEMVIFICLIKLLFWFQKIDNMTKDKTNKMVNRVNNIAGYC